MTGSSAPRRRGRVTTRRLAMFLASALAAALVSVPDAAPAAAGPPDPTHKVWHPRPLPPEHSVAGVKPKGRRTPSAPPAAPARPKPVTWPAAASADVDLTPAAAGTGTPAAKTAGVAVPGTPVTLTADDGSAFLAALSGSAGSAGSTGPLAPRTPSLSKVRVTVADHGTAVKAGVPGVIVSLARADGVAAPASVDVAVDYSGFVEAAGGDFADRLRLVELPACALTTPQLADCQKATPVAAANDRAGARLTATVSLPGGTADGSPPPGPPDAPIPAAATGSPAAPAVVLAAVSSTDGSTGTYAATTLKPSDTWSTDGTGSFTADQPITMPPALGGTAPAVSLGYDSGSVDGRTTAANGQASMIGDGWDYNPGFIERSYKPCAKVDPTNWGGVGDSCLTTPNATLSLPGHAGDLVRDDATGIWRIAGDDGSRVELLNGADNGTSNPKALQEYWRVTTSDGTRYYFGANRIPGVEGGTGTDAPTYSTWSEPVFGTGEATCNDPTKASAIKCMAAWRWNLDFVIDRHGNVVRYDYLREGNWYKNPVTNAENFYTRGGYLASIDYGFRQPDVLANAKPAAQVVFGVKPRCLPAGLDVSYANMCTSLSVTPDPNNPGFARSGISASTMAAFQDTPFDLSCDGTSACARYGPSFWTSIRLDTVTTAVAYTPGTSPRIVAGTGANPGYLPVDEYTLHQSMSADTTVPILWLDAISHSGFTGGVTTSLPDVQFSSILLPNRAPAAGAGAVAYSRRRLSQITDELRGITAVTYDYDPQNVGIRRYPCTATAPAVDKNTTLCFPVWWTPPAATTPALDWFNKWVVINVQRSDGTDLAGRNQSSQYLETAYQYPDAPAWHSDDSELADPKYRTFDQFRGFAHIVTIGGGQLNTAGSPADGLNSKTVVTYFRGMDEDPDLACQKLRASSPTASCAASDVPYVYVKDSTGAQTLDDNALAGRVLEKQVYESADPAAQVYTDTITDQTANGPSGGATAQHLRSGGLPRERARFLHTASTVTFQKVSTGTRRSETDYVYDDRLPVFSGAGTSQGNGRVVATYDLGDGTVPKVCTTTLYARNTTKADTAQWTDYPWKVSTSVQPTANCTGADPAPAPLPDQIDQGFTQTSYDAAPAGQITGAADATMVQQESDASGTMVVKTQTPLSDFDAYGRALSTTDGLGRKTSTVYTPFSGVLPTSEAVTNPMGWVSTTALDQTRGLTLTAKDPNGQVTTVGYDGLGRTTAVWQPGRATSSSPSTRFTYSVAPVVNNIQEYSSVLTETLREDNSYGAAYQIIDGLGRVEQSQTTPTDGSLGQVVTDAVYDFDGRVRLASGQHWDGNNNPSGTWLSYDYTLLDSITTTAYDAMSRATNVTLSKGGNNLWATNTTYYGADRTDVKPPSGGVATTTITDVRGQPTARWQYHENPPAAPGAAGDADITKYTYTPVTNGATTTVTDPSGNTWTTIEDLLGRPVQQADPNSGTTTMHYDAGGQVLGTRDGRGQDLSFLYDNLGRKTFTYAGTDTTNSANLLSKTVYDQSRFEDPSGTVGAVVLGQPTFSTRYVGGASGAAYTQSTPYYDYQYRARRTQTTIPSTGPDAGLAGTYVSDSTYTPVTGLLYTTDLPAVPNAGLPVETMYYAYNQSGLLTQATGNADYLYATQFSPFGEIVARTLGDYPYQVTQQTVYDPTTRRVTSSTVDATAGVNPATRMLNKYGVDWTSFTFNAAGQLTSASDQQGLGSPATVDTQCYTYDFANRLKEAWTDEGGAVADKSMLIDGGKITSAPIPGGVGHCADTAPALGTITAPAGAGAPNGPSPAPYWQTFTGDTPYSATDPMGNRVTVTDHSVTGGADTTHKYTPSAPAGARNTGSAPAGSGTGPALLGTVSTTGGTTATDRYGYDGAGNTTSRTVTSTQTPMNENLTWDPEGHVATVTDAAANTQVSAFVYDTAGNELIRRDATSTTLFLGTTEIHLTTAGPGAGKTTAQRYTAFPDAPTTIEGSDGTFTIEAANQQGTGSATLQDTPGATDQGKVIARRYTKPYGESRGTAVTQTTTPAWPDDHSFLGKSTDAATALVDVGARKYDPTTGRFISADPVDHPGDAQSIGGYAYAGNDPVSASDPTGLDPHTCSPGYHNQSVNGEMECLPDSTSGGSGGGGGSGSGGSQGGSGGGDPTPHPQCGSGTRWNGHGCVSTTCQVGAPGCPGPVHHGPWVGPASWSTEPGTLPPPPLSCGAPFSVQAAIISAEHFSCQPAPPTMPPLVRPSDLSDSQWQIVRAGAADAWTHCVLTDAAHLGCNDANDYIKAGRANLPPNTIYKGDGTTGGFLSVCFFGCLGFSRGDDGSMTFSVGGGYAFGISGGQYVSTPKTDHLQISVSESVGPAGVTANVGKNSSSISAGSSSFGFKFGAALMFNWGKGVG